MGAVLRCELCDGKPRLELPIRFASLMVFHTVIDHGWPIERVERAHRMMLPSGEAIWGLGSLGRKRAHVAVWRVRNAQRPADIRCDHDTRGRRAWPGLSARGCTQ